MTEQENRIRIQKAEVAPYVPFRPFLEAVEIDMRCRSSDLLPVQTPSHSYRNSGDRVFCLNP